MENIWESSGLVGVPAVQKQKTKTYAVSCLVSVAIFFVKRKYKHLFAHAHYHLLENKTFNQRCSAFLFWLAIEHGDKHKSRNFSTTWKLSDDERRLWSFGEMVKLNKKLILHYLEDIRNYHKRESVQISLTNKKKIIAMEGSLFNPASTSQSRSLKGKNTLKFWFFCVRY